MFGSDDHQFSVPTDLVAELAAGEHADFSITFTPTLEGDRFTTVTIETNAVYKSSDGTTRNICVLNLLHWHEAF